MKKCLLLLLSALLLSVSFGFSQVPDSHPARQMRKYYADVYTGSSIIAYESESLDSVLFVVSQFIEPAQVISVYSYKENPYKYRNPFNPVNYVANNQKTPTDPLEKIPISAYTDGGFLLSCSETKKPIFRTFGIPLAR